MKICTHQFRKKNGLGTGNAVSNAEQRAGGGYKHKGKGLCHSCWDRERSKNPKRKAYMKVNRDRWERKFRALPNYHQIVNRLHKEWQLKYPEHYKALWKRNGLRLKFIRFIKSPIQYKYKKYKNAIKYYCDDCGKEIQTPIIEKIYLVGRELKYFKQIHNKMFHKEKVENNDWVKV